MFLALCLFWVTIVPGYPGTYTNTSESGVRDRHVNSIPWKLYVKVYARDHGPQEMQPSTSCEDQGRVLEEETLWGRRWRLPGKRLNFTVGGKSMCEEASNTWKSPELQESWWGWCRGERGGRDVQRWDEEGAFMPCQHVWRLANETWGEMHLRIISRGVM